jgi:FkbM family methyltransferase
MKRRLSDTPRVLRATLARRLMSPQAVRLVEPCTRRRIRHLGVTIQCDPEIFSPYTRAELFWGLYERAECDYIRRYLDGSTYSIELGAGLGVSSAHVAAGLAPGATLICVEANPTFMSAVERNVAPYARRSHVDATVINAAIGPGSGTSTLNIQANPFASSTSTYAGAGSVDRVQVATRSLQSIVEEYQPASFDLVCDIEGAEGGVIMCGGQSGLERCRRLVIELHPCSVGGTILTPDDLLRALSQRWGFSVLARKGPIAALAR